MKIIQCEDGVAGNRIFLKHLFKPGLKPVPLIADNISRNSVAADGGDTFYVLTNPECTWGT